MGCPSATFARGDSPGGTGYIDYWYNRNLSGVKPNAVSVPAHTITLGDGSDGIERNDATYSRINLPATWIADASKPCWRHLGGANYLFSDGHVGWRRPTEITTMPGQLNTFSLR